MTKWTGGLLVLSMLTGQLVVCETEQEFRAECEMWSHLENKSLPLQNEGHAHCTTNKDCTGFVCDGNFKDSPVEFGMNVLNCQEPPGLEIFGSAPHFLAANFSHVFKHGSKYEIPTAMLNIQDISGLPKLPFSGGKIPGMNLYFVVNMEPLNHNQTFNTLRIGLEVQACLNHSALNIDAKVRKSRQLENGEVCIMKKPVIENTEIPVPHCATRYPAPTLVGDPCRLGEVFSCGDHQTCVPTDPDTSEGLCECLSEFERMPDKTCGLRPQMPDRASSSNNNQDAQPVTADNRDDESGSGAVIGAVIAAAAVCAVLVGFGLLFRRLRVWRRLRAKMQNTPYEDIVIADQVENNNSIRGSNSGSGIANYNTTADRNS